MTITKTNFMPWFAILILAFGLTTITNVRAAPINDPSDFVRAFGEAAIAVLSNDSLSESDRQTELRGLFKDNFNISIISRFVLGKHWRKATDTERSEYTLLFEDYMIATYGRRLKAYSSEELVVGDASQADDNHALVSSKIIRAGGQPIQINWQLLRTDEHWYVVDIVVEGLSMALTQRSEFAAVIQSNKIEGLLTALRSKIVLSQR